MSANISEIPKERLVSWLRAYYLLITYLIAKEFDFLSNSPIQTTKFSGTLTILPDIALPFFSLANMYWFAIASTVLAAFFCRFMLFRILHFISFFLVVGIFFSSIRSNFHSLHIGIFISFFLIFVFPGSSRSYLASLRDLLISLIAANYGLTGFWKVKEIFASSGWDRILGDLMTIFPQHFAYSMAEGSLRPNFLNQLILSFPALSAFCWVFVILAELSSFIVIFKPRLAGYWILAIVLFHLVIGLAQGIWFHSAAVLLLVLYLTEDPYYSAKSSNISDPTRPG